MELAICHVSIAPLRAENSDRSEMISQLLFGECMEILEIKDSWTWIRCLHDNYEAWIDNKQYIKLNKEQVNSHISLQSSHVCHLGNKTMNLVLGSNLPNFDGINFSIEKTKYLYNGKAIEVAKNPISNLRKIALKYEGAPYLWGGRNPFGIDCSGFTQMVYKFFSISLPRDAYQQASIGETLNFVGEAREGDLAFFGKEDKITHVGICLGNNEIIHASGMVRIDTLDHVGIYNKENKKYSHFLKIIKRVNL
ncbi:MAG: C40 family peptidase [Chitinophagales bacterium]|nr:C40 family peptidase [Chitinophagales bacterium]